MVPGFEGIYQVKYLRRIKLVDRYYMTYDDYGHINPDPKVAALTHMIGPKSVITFPSGGQKLQGPGFYEISGLAWSGGGRHPRCGDFRRRRQDLEDCRASVTAYPMAHTRFGYALEVGRQGVHASCRAARTNWARFSRLAPKPRNTGISLSRQISASRARITPFSRGE